MSDYYNKKHDKGKEPYHLIPEVCIRELYREFYDEGSKYIYANIYNQRRMDEDLDFYRSIEFVKDVLEYGRDLYGAETWKDLPDAQQRYMAASIRHKEECSNPLPIDAESRLPHIAHELTNYIFLLYFEIKEDRS